MKSGLLKGKVEGEVNRMREGKLKEEDINCMA